MKRTGTRSRFWVGGALLALVAVGCDAPSEVTPIRGPIIS